MNKQMSSSRGRLTGQPQTLQVFEQLGFSRRRQLRRMCYGTAALAASCLLCAALMHQQVGASVSAAVVDSYDAAAQQPAAQQPPQRQLQAAAQSDEDEHAVNDVPDIPEMDGTEDGDHRPNKTDIHTENNRGKAKGDLDSETWKTSVAAVHPRAVKQQADKKKPTKAPAKSKYFGYGVYSRPRPTHHYIYAGKDGARMTEIFGILDQLGWRKGNYTDDWEFAWSNKYMFKSENTFLYDLKPHHKVCQVPGNVAVIVKAKLIKSRNIPEVPKAFSLPLERKTFLEYARAHPDKVWLQKNSGHRGLHIRTPEEIEKEWFWKLSNTFIQEFVRHPYLVDGHKFDFGVYTTVTSTYPLRVYAYDAHTRVRICAEPYEPFDPENLAKFALVGIHQIHPQQLPTLRTLMSKFGVTEKEALKLFFREQGVDPELVWHKLYDLLRRVFLDKAKAFRKGLDMWLTSRQVQFHPRNFFELMRSDIIMDSKQDLHLMEVNMSPELYNSHGGSPDQVMTIVRKMLYSTYSLTGLAKRQFLAQPAHNSTRGQLDMGTSDDDLRVDLQFCKQTYEADKADCTQPHQMVCQFCLKDDPELVEALWAAYQEHNSREGYRRIIPEPIAENDSKRFDDAEYETYLGEHTTLSPRDQALWWWFRGKCRQDRAWCS